ncbi:hypothetical protein BBO99_00008123 [Phytophthora kernoviae]|uniref:Transmembrane protein n=2 Tax=Phytophthora kernoviae TaxID=325452 RepID=A0A3R7GQT8_9STRA|nr:hypothetical protein G195_008661 [Phytophthora kernoviae 00238/432]KAG2514632.1 hypothetical protein JM16_007829 [Phytophthora kernoviae]KAG2519095.1 hypothetical protein JM18_005731 [Phytophthora kernoviae]RLN31621.1 hypothetical protein BBI17_008036 [Phytophthora kernoviae]RLN75721.1 hypothetical protein BBO99_00008123 [Phytophthora kernoviae]
MTQLRDASTHPTTPDASKLSLGSPGINYEGVKTPVDIEGGALEPGGVPSVYSWKHLGLLAHIASVGVVYGTLSGVLYAVLNNYLYMSAVLTATAQALVRLPRALRFFAAIFSDCYPIFGYRRRPYLIIGWVITFTCCFLMAVLPLGDPYYGDPALADIDEDEMTAEQQALINYDAPNKGIKLIIFFVLANIGTVISFGASDGYMVELARREPEAIRGTVQSHVSAVRQVFMILAAFMTGLGLNSEDYGGDFSWSMGFNAIMGVCAAFSFVTIPLCWFCITEEKAPRKSMRTFFVSMFNLVQHRVMFQVIAFRFFRQILSLFSVTASSPIQSTWANVTPLNEGLSEMISCLVTFISLWIVRRYGLHWSWRAVVIVCQVGVVFVDAFPTFFTIWDVYRSQWFWLGVPLLAEFPNSIGDFIASLFVVEVVDKGSEASVMGLMITISALGTPFSTVMYKSVDSYFDIERKFIVKDTHHVRTQVSYAYLIAYACNLLSLVFVVWLPRQKAEVHALKAQGGKNKLLGQLTVCYLVFAFFWILMTNVLSLFDSTSCLRIAGALWQRMVDLLQKVYLSWASRNSPVELSTSDLAASNFGVYLLKTTVPDVYDRHVRKKWDEFLHVVVVGDADKKEQYTEELLAAWVSHPTWPMLHVRFQQSLALCGSFQRVLSSMLKDYEADAEAAEAAEAAADPDRAAEDWLEGLDSPKKLAKKATKRKLNVDLVCEEGANSAKEITRLKNAIGMHLFPVPPEVEKYENTVLEGAAVGAITVTYNTPIMQEWVPDSCGLRVGSFDFDGQTNTGTADDDNPDAEKHVPKGGDGLDHRDRELAEGAALVKLPSVHVTNSEIERGIEQLLELDRVSRVAAGRAARVHYLRMRTHYLSAVAALDAAVCEGDSDDLGETQSEIGQHSRKKVEVETLRAFLY